MCDHNAGFSYSSIRLTGSKWGNNVSWLVFDIINRINQNTLSPCSCNLTMVFPNSLGECFLTYTRVDIKLIILLGF